MRKLYFICLFFLFMAFGCADRSADVPLATRYPEFQAYEELLISNPDSVISQIKAFEKNTKLSPRYADSVHLVLIKVYINNADNYSNNWDKLSNAKGDLKIVEDMVESLRYLDEMDENQETIYLRGMAYAYMGNAFMHVFDGTKTLECREQAYSFYAKIHEDRKLFPIAVCMAISYYANNDSKKAEMYCQKGDSLYALLNDTTVIYHYCCDINRIRAYIMYDENQKEEAYSLIYGKLAGENSLYIRRYYESVLADFYYWDKVPDSAIIYAENTLQLEQSSYVEYYEMLIELYQAKGDSAKASYYTNELAVLTSANYTQTSDKSKMVSVYEQYESDRAVALRNIRYKRYALWIGLALLLIWALVFLFMMRKKKRQKEESQKKDWYIGVLSGKVRQKNADLNDKEKQLQALKSELSKTKTEQVDAVPGLDVEERMKLFKAKPICVHILTSVDAVIKTRSDYPELQLNDEQMAKFMNAINESFYRLPYLLKEAYPRLTQSDIEYCSFCLLGLTDKQVAAMTGKSYHTVWVRSNKIHEIFDSTLPISQIMFELLEKWYGQHYPDK